MTTQSPAGSLLVKTALLALSTAFALLAAEVIVGFVMPQNLSGSWIIETDKGLRANKSQGNARHQLGKRVVTYDFAAPHLRGPSAVGKVRVLIVGDSFTFGWLLDDKSNYVSLLQRKLDERFGPNAIALLNAATGGWGTADQVAFIEDFGALIKPDVVLAVINTDDIGRALDSRLFQFDETTRTLTRTAVARSRIKDAVNGVPGYQWLLEHSNLVQLARVAAAGSLAATKSVHSASAAAKADPAKTGPRSKMNPGDARRARALGAALFERLNSWCKEQQIPLIITTSGWHQPPYDDTEPTRVFMSGAGELFASMGVLFFDGSAEIWRQRKATGEQFAIPKDGHPNEAGAALIADSMYPFVSEQLERICRQTGRCK